MKKKLFFDLDGTVADLYASPTWLPDLRSEKPGTFVDLPVMVDMDELALICKELELNGWEIGVITWLPMNCSKEYEEICTAEKKIWCSKYMPYVGEFHALSYGVPKHSVAKGASRMVLIDDKQDICDAWDTPVMRSSINATVDMMGELRKLI